MLLAERLLFVVAKRKAQILSDLKIQHLSLGGGVVSDGAVMGLYYEPSKKVGAHGTFFLRYTSPETNTRKRGKIGNYPQLSLAEAREKARELKSVLSEGYDPFDSYSRGLPVKSFRDLALEYFERQTNQSADYLQRKRALLENHVFGLIGGRGLKSLLTSEFAALIEPIAENSPRTSGEVKQLCFNIMAYATAKQYVSNNPLQYVEKLMDPSLVSTRRIEKHHPAISVDDIPHLVSDIISDPKAGNINRALLFLILTATRSGETRGMFWSELDMTNELWHLPPERTKTRRPAKLPLSNQAMKILAWQQQFYDGNEYVFPSIRGGEMSKSAFKSLLRDYESDAPNRPPTPHGMRSTFRRWAKLQELEDGLVEANLTHGEPNKTYRAYLRDVMDDATMMGKRRQIMEQWGGHCFSRTSQNALDNLELEV